MSDEMTCVKDTVNNYYFDKIEKNTVFLLRDDLAKEAWDRKIDKGSTSYFRLSKGCWITSDNREIVGHWVEAYNNDNNAIVEKFLRRTVDWVDDSFILFFPDGLTAFRTRWRSFLQFCDDFLAFEDDCPIVMLEPDGGREAIVFAPTGYIIKITGAGQR